MKKLLLIGGICGAALVLLSVFSGGYGTRIELKKGELYYSETVTLEEAQSLADFLNNQYGEVDNEITFQVDRVENEICVRMCAQPSTWETDDSDYMFSALELLIQANVFEEENVKIQLCDESMEVKKTIDSIPWVTS